MLASALGPSIPEMRSCAARATFKPLAAFCRCWKSKNMPYCNGSQGAHNKETGDNMGALLVPVKA